MFAHTTVSRWVVPDDLRHAVRGSSLATSAPVWLPSSRLQTETHPPGELEHAIPAFPLRPADMEDRDKLPEKGTVYDARRLRETCLPIGHVYFHPGSHRLPFACRPDVEAFASVHLEYPRVVDNERAEPCETSHILLADLVMDPHGMNGNIGLYHNSTPLVRLYKIAADTSLRAVDPATHVKGGEQMAGVDVWDWGMCHFDEAYRCADLGETFRRIYCGLRRRH